MILSGRNAEIVGIVGMRGTGKSTLFSHILNKAQNSNRIILYDTLREHNFKETETFKIFDYETPFEDVAFNVWENGNVLFAVEEIEFHISKHVLSDLMRKIISLGRHRGIGLMWTTRRFADVHNLLVSQTSHLFIFRMVLPQDIDYLKEFVGSEAERVKNLPKHYFYYWNGESLKLYKPLSKV